MISGSPIPAVVPAGRMAASEQPVLGLPGGLELRPWRVSDADALMAAGQDPGIRHWNRLLVETPEDARRRIERMHERRRAELSAIWAVARPGGEAIGPGPVRRIMAGAATPGTAPRRVAETPR